MSRLFIFALLASFAWSHSFTTLPGYVDYITLNALCLPF